MGNCQGKKALSCSVGHITLDGTDHHFTVEALNFYLHKTTTTFTWKAIGRPADWTSDLNLDETGRDDEFTPVSYTHLDVYKRQDQGDVGTAYVVGNQVRYIAPKTVAEPIDVDIQYVAKAGRRGATGDISVTVNPEPTDANPDSPPQPTSIEGRATAGDTITIPIPASGQDPDGDSVALVGLGSGPQLGRVTRITAKGITYQAFPTDDSLGTDQFAYVVTDKYGQTGTGVLRVAVVPPGQTQTPMTVDDMVTAKPGSAVRIDAIANDLIAMNDKVTIKALANPPSGVALAGDQGPITATAPAAKAEPLTVNLSLIHI